MPKTDKYSELEAKFAADDVNEDQFLTWGILRKPVKYTSSSCPDVYYVNNNSDVVRHRWSDNGSGGQLTVKQRKSLKSIANRVEIDLEFAVGTQIEDVTKFLVTSGFKKTVVVYKEKCHVFWYEEDGANLTLSLYAVRQLNEKTKKCGPSHHFVEVEVEKNSNISNESAIVLLEKWKNELMHVFELAKPTNLSLYELFSGCRYKKA